MWCDALWCGALQLRAQTAPGCPKPLSLILPPSPRANMPKQPAALMRRGTLNNSACISADRHIASDLPRLFLLLSLSLSLSPALCRLTLIESLSVLPLRRSSNAALLAQRMTAVWRTDANGDSSMSMLTCHSTALLPVGGSSRTNVCHHQRSRLVPVLVRASCLRGRHKIRHKIKKKKHRLQRASQTHSSLSPTHL